MLLSKLSLFLFPCIASVLYQLSMPFEGWPSILSAAVLTVLGHGAIMIVMRVRNFCKENHVNRLNYMM